MAKRGKNKRSRRRNTAINLLNVGEAYLQTAIWTEAAFRLSPINFVLGESKTGTVAGSGGWAYGAGKVSLKELVLNFGKEHGSSGKTEADLVKENLEGQWLSGLLKTVGVGIGFKVMKKILSKPRRQINAGLKAAQLNTMVKV